MLSAVAPPGCEKIRSPAGRSKPRWTAERGGEGPRARAGRCPPDDLIRPATDAAEVVPYTALFFRLGLVVQLPSPASTISGHHRARSPPRSFVRSDHATLPRWREHPLAASAHMPDAEEKLRLIAHQLARWPQVRRYRVPRIPYALSTPVDFFRTARQRKSEPATVGAEPGRVRCDSAGLCRRL